MIYLENLHGGLIVFVFVLKLLIPNMKSQLLIIPELLPLLSKISGKNSDTRR